MLTCPPGRFAVFRAISSPMTTLNSRTASTPSNWPLAPPGVILISEAPVYSMPFNRKRFSCGRRPDTANMLPTAELDVPTPPERSPCSSHGGVERHQFVVTAAVERQVFYLALADQPGRLLGETITGEGASSTVISCLNSPTVRVKSTTPVCPTWRVMPVRNWLVNPVCEAVT